MFIIPEDISSLKENTKLQSLGLGFNKIKDISILSNNSIN
uniref:Uncharacterized protein n=1 Tax=Clostridium perfringens TaxID=1502 RepID=A0A4Y5T5N5_CLOPF|nr:hypothetical protein [Clostridium perfringens]